MKKRIIFVLLMIPLFYFIYSTSDSFVNFESLGKDKTQYALHIIKKWAGLKR